jgi:hypothetical protein
MKYNRTYHFPFSPGATNDDRIADSVDMLIGVPIVGTEKMDGENTDEMKDGVYARSHAAFTTSPWSRAVRELHARIGHQIPEGVHMFGENMEGVHSIEYERLESYFYLFGVRDNMRWLSWTEVEEYAFLFDVPTVPVLFKGVVNSRKELQDLVEHLSKQPSILGGEREGVVFRTEEGFSDEEFGKKILKWVRPNHVRTSEHWTRNWKRAKLWQRC